MNRTMQNDFNIVAMPTIESVIPSIAMIPTIQSFPSIQTLIPSINTIYGHYWF